MRFNHYTKTKEGKPSTRKALVELPVAEFIDKPAPKLDFILPGLLAETVGVIVVTDKFFPLQLLMSIASGADCLGGLFSSKLSPWRGELKSGGEKVVYLSLEEPADVWTRIRSCSDVLEHRRERLNDAQIAALKRNLKIVSPGREPFDVDEPNWRDYLNALALGWSEEERDADSEDRETAAKAGEMPPFPIPTKNAPRLIVIDSFDENQRGRVTGVFAALETAARLGGGAVLYALHSSKAAEGGESVHEYWESCPLVENARFAAVMRRESEGARYPESDLRVSFPKVNYCSVGDDLHFRRRENGVLLFANSMPSDATFP